MKNIRLGAHGNCDTCGLAGDRVEEERYCELCDELGSPRYIAHRYNITSNAPEEHLYLCSACAGKLILPQPPRYHTPAPALALIALDSSIAHWRAMHRDSVDAFIDGHAPTIDACACCVQYFDRGCQGCPIKEHTGQKLCRGIPYDLASDFFYLASAHPAKWQRTSQSLINSLLRVRQTHCQKYGFTI